MSQQRITKGLVVEMLNKGMRPIDIAEALGVSKQLVSHHMHNTGVRVASPKEVVDNTLPWELPEEHRAGPYRRVRLHARFMAGQRMNAYANRTLTAWWRRQLDRNEILAYVPDAPEAHGANAGWRYVPRTDADDRMAIREDQHTKLTDTARVVWRIPPEDTWP